jgi:cell division protein ZapA (FtsZ GTPase activity inhibitor)
MIEERIINVLVGGRQFPVKVDKLNESEEEIIRLASKIVNGRMQEYQIHFSDKEKFDILAMVSLEIASELVKEKQKKEVAVDESTILRISRKLDQVLGD